MMMGYKEIKKFKEVKELSERSLRWMEQLSPDAYGLYADLIQWFLESKDYKKAAVLLLEYHPGITVEEAVDKIRWTEEMKMKLEELQNG
jgi:hypothetical protein